MTIQQDATTRPNTEQTKAQIADENSAADLANGFIPDQEPGASDAATVSEADAPKKSSADIVRDQQQKAADDREALMQDIAHKRRQFMQDGMEDEDDAAQFNEGLDNTDESLENQEQEQVAEVAQDVQQETELQPVQDNQPRFFTHTDGKQYCELTVNGTKTVVPAERVYAAAQKMEAGDQRLREANEAQKRLREDQQRFEQQQQAARQIQQPSVDPDADANLKAQLRKDFERLVNEGDDSAIDALVERLAGRQQAIPQIDPHQIAAEAITINNQRAWDADLVVAAEQFNADPTYADINGNEILAGRATEIAKQLVIDNDARNRNVHPLRIMQQAAEQARNEARQYAQALGLSVPQGHTQQVAVRADATAARKQQLGNTTTGGAAPRPAASTATKPANPDGGRNPTSVDSKVSAFAQMQAMRNTPAIKR